MARTRNNKLFGLFKKDFKITFYYKPTMLNDDVFHYIILDDLVKLKIKVIYGALVIDDIIPLTTTYLAKIYDTLIGLLIDQSEYTVLVSTTGNTASFSSVCIKAGAPIIDDPRFLCIPKKLYDSLREQYKEDTSKYGFYLLAVKELKEGEIPDENSIEAGRLPLIDKILIKIEDTFKNTVTVVADYKDWSKGKILDINGIRFKITFDTETKSVGLYNFDLNSMNRYFDLLSLCTLLEEYAKRGSIVLYEVSSPLLFNICSERGYRNISDTLQRRQISINQRYTSSRVFGDYKIEKMNL